MREKAEAAPGHLPPGRIYFCVFMVAELRVCANPNKGRNRPFAA
jgi:hypothetical protein